MSQFEFDDIPDDIFAAIPNDALSGMHVSPFTGFDQAEVSFHPTLARSQDLVLAPPSGLSLFPSQFQASRASTFGGLDWEGDGTLQLTPTHVSPSRIADMDRSQSPSTQRDGPMTWVDDHVRLSQQSGEVRDRLLSALAARDQGQVLNLMKGFDDNSIRDGVDLIIAGMLEHKALSKSLAQSLQKVMLLLISDRGIKFATNHRFAGLLETDITTSPRKSGNKPKESHQDIVHRVWGEKYHQALGLDSTFSLLEPLARLAHYSEILNQHPDQLSKYLQKYSASRLENLRPGRRERITGDDIKALNRDLRAIVVNAHHRYTSLIAPRLLPGEGNVVGLERLGK